MKQKTPAEYVNPYIGSVSHLTLSATVPTVMLPHGTARIAPRFFPNMPDCYFADSISAFALGDMAIMFAAGDAPDMKSACSRFDVSLADTHPYACRYELEDTGITVEGTVTCHAFVYRVSGAEKIFIEAKRMTAWEETEDALYLTLPCDKRKWDTAQRMAYYRIRFSAACRTEVRESGITVTDIPEVCEIYVTLSYISYEKAAELDRTELGGGNFDAAVQNAKQVWESLLGKIKVRGNSEDMKTVYYTALHRSFSWMINYGENGQYYSGYDRAVHDGDAFYATDMLWDSFRCMHPLQLLLEPENHKRMLDSYVTMYRQSGAMPSFPSRDADAPIMIGFHAASLFADGLAKGFDTDYEAAYEGIYRNATVVSMLPWTADKPADEPEKCYYENGFYPALEADQEEWIDGVVPWEKRQSVTVTLEHAYDDWCAAQIAKHLGKEDDYRMFMRRSQNYRTVYNADIGFMAPKNAAGEWVKGYDPMLGGGQGGRDYFTECNGYIYNFSVLHDVEGLADLMGGREAMSRRLDELFTTSAPNKYRFLNQFPDSTGLMGMFCMGNEPGFHIPFLYNYCGKPWMTQRRLRTIIDLWFTNSPLGICGDEDSGAMSSWLAFAAIGLYPVCPGKAEYALAAPVFDEVVITVSGGEFVIRAEGAGEGKRYIQSAKLNGKDYSRAFLSHADLTAGGELVLVMGDRPNREWGLDE